MNDLAAAAERVRRHNSGDDPMDKAELFEEYRKLANAYLALVPAVAKPMTEPRLRELLGEWMPSDPQDVADLLDSANADAHETVDWMPRYKAALSCLAQQLGMLTGTLNRLRTALAGQPAATTIVTQLAEGERLWQAHLCLISDTYPRDRTALGVTP